MRNALELKYSNTGVYTTTDGWVSIPGSINTELVIPAGTKYLPKLPTEPGGPGALEAYQYWTKDYDSDGNPANGRTVSGASPCLTGMSDSDRNRYGFYTRLENVSTSDPNYISITVGDGFDKCIATHWSVNYRIGN